MTGAFSLAGWHFSRNPTSSSSENRVHQAVDSEPWKTGNDARYQYHPHGDTSKGKKDAPSALNEVIIPNVNLPKVRGGLLESQWTGYGHRVSPMDQLTMCRLSTRSTTSGARRDTRRIDKDSGRGNELSVLCTKFKHCSDRASKAPALFC